MPPSDWPKGAGRPAVSQASLRAALLRETGTAEQRAGAAGAPSAERSMGAQQPAGKKRACEVMLRPTSCVGKWGNSSLTSWLARSSTNTPASLQTNIWGSSP